MLLKKSVLKIWFSLKISTNVVVISEKLWKVYSQQVGLPGDIEDPSHLTNVLIQRKRKKKCPTYQEI